MKKRLVSALTCSFGVAASALVAAASPSDSGEPPPGSTKETAIEVCMPRGQHEYLARLRCPDGSAPTFGRRGNVGPRTPYPEQEAGETRADYMKRIAGMAPDFRGLPLKQGEPDRHTVDGYDVTCGDVRHMVYMDMYHCTIPVTTRAPRGFSLVPAATGPQ